MSKEIFLYSEDKKYKCAIELADSLDKFKCPDHSRMILFEERENGTYIIAQASDKRLETEKDLKIADLEAKLAQAQKTIEIQKMSNDALIDENLDYRYNITDTAYELAKGIAEDWESGYKDEILELKSELALTKKALELAVVDKCEFENKFYSMVFGIANGKLPCPKREQWYKEQAEKEMKSE